MFGYDRFNDIRRADNHQSGSDRIISAGAILSGTGAGENDLFPIFLGDGTTTIQWNPIIEESEGSDFLTHSGFINDNWRMSDRLTANAGIRFDKNHGADQSGNVVAKDSAWSPRLGIVWDPNGRAWSVTASVASSSPRFQTRRRFVGGQRQPAEPHLPLSRRQHQRPGTTAPVRRRRFARCSTGSSTTVVREDPLSSARRFPA